jgi:preprotein translocase subunit YajC
MLSMLLLPAQVLAQESEKASPLPTIIMFAFLGLVMYFLMIRPQRRRMREAQELVRQIAEGDEVITTGGIYGFISAIDGDVMWLDIAEGVEIRVHRSSIARKIDPVKEPAGGEVVAAADDAATTDDGDSKKKK